MSSTTPFHPHGLIKTPMQQQFYNKAHLANVFTGMADPKEHATVALMEVLLYRNIFTEEHFAVTSEQPKRCDLVVNYLEEGSDKIRTFCFAECKRAKKSLPFSLKALEKQAKDYCKAYVDYESAPFVYAATMAGAHVRLWKYTLGGDSLTPFWGKNDDGNWQQYKDVGIDTDGRLIEDSFNSMKYWTPTPHAGQTSSDYSTYQPAMPHIPSSHLDTNPTQATSGFPSVGNQMGSASTYVGTGQGFGSEEYQMSSANMYAGTGQESCSNENQTGSNTGQETGYEAYQSYRDSQMGGSTMEATMSGGGSGPRLVARVSKIPHTTRKDEFMFRDKIDRKRYTVLADWSKVQYNGQSAWMCGNYVCLDANFGLGI